MYSEACSSVSVADLICPVCICDVSSFAEKSEKCVLQFLGKLVYFLEIREELTKSAVAFIHSH